MPRCIPERPALTTASERQVWETLRDQLGDEDLLLANLRITDRRKDHEIDIAAVMPGAGIVVVEVKGGAVWCDADGWMMKRRGDEVRIHPADQARDAKYALRSYVCRDPRWPDSARLRWAHAVVLPFTDLAEDFEAPDLPRWSVLDRSQLGDLATHLRDIAVQQETAHRPPTPEDVDRLAAILAGRGLPQYDLVAVAAEREAVADRLTQEQAVILGAIQQLHRVEIRGGAGSGKTWLALEQARRLRAQGQRVALLCYSRGLAAYLTRHVSTWKRQEQPSYVGTFHALGLRWGAQPGTDDDSDYWETRLPEQMRELAMNLAAGNKFDAVVIDEAQDFADAWWPALLAALRDEAASGLYVFSDDGQRVFARYGRPPVPLVPLVLDHNLRNTRQIGDAFQPLTPMKMRLFGGEGPAVRYVECAATEAIARADGEVDRLLDEGWKAQHVALLTTGSRHPEQTDRQGFGQDAYWDSYWDTEQVFYGHVLGFKGLERNAVVLAVNEESVRDRARERLYVGLSRARDQLVVCGDPAYIEQVAGADVLRRLRRGSVQEA